MKLNTVAFISIFVIFTAFTAGAGAEISMYQAGKLTGDYVFENEVSVTDGPYTYNGNDYFITELVLSPNPGTYGTIFVIDREKGTIVSDRTTYYEVSKIYLHMEDIRYYDYPTTYLENNRVIRDDIAYWDSSQVFWEDIADSATRAEEKNAANEAASLCDELIAGMNAELNTTQSLILALNDIYSGYPIDYEISSYVELQSKLDTNYKDSQKIVLKATERFPKIYGQFTDTSSAFEIEKYEWKQYENGDLEELGNLNDNYNTLTVEESDLWIEDNLDWSWESMNDRMTEYSESTEPENSLPGFGIICSVSAVLFMAVLMRKR